MFTSASGRMLSSNPYFSALRKPKPREIVQRTQGYAAANGLWEAQVFRPDPRPWKVPELPAGWLVGGSGSKLSKKPVPVPSHAGPRLVWAGRSDHRVLCNPGLLAAP